MAAKEVRQVPVCLSRDAALDIRIIQMGFHSAIPRGALEFHGDYSYQAFATIITRNCVAFNTVEIPESASNASPKAGHMCPTQPAVLAIGEAANQFFGPVSPAHRQSHFAALTRSFKGNDCRMNSRERLPLDHVVEAINHPLGVME